MTKREAKETAVEIYETLDEDIVMTCEGDPKDIKAVRKALVRLLRSEA